MSLKEQIENIIRIDYCDVNCTESHISKFECETDCYSKICAYAERLAPKIADRIEIDRKAINEWICIAWDFQLRWYRQWSSLCEEEKLNWLTLLKDKYLKNRKQLIIEVEHELRRLKYFDYLS